MPTGINSFKVLRNERRHHNSVGVETHLLPSDGQVNVNPDRILPLYRGSVNPGDKGRTHYEPMHSNVKEWKVCMRQSAMSRAYGSEAPDLGKKPLPEPPRKPDPPQCKKMITMPDGTYYSERRGQEIGGLCVGFKSLKHFEARAVAPEYDMETYMNKKQRAGESIDRMRNGIGVAVPGDRPFKVSEHEPGFFAKGGLIPGSSIQLRKSAKPERRAGEAASRARTGEKRLSFKEKQRAAAEKYDQDQVSQLTESFERQGNEVPSFEQRTGAFLVKPEDEAY